MTNAQKNTSDPTTGAGDGAAKLEHGMALCLSGGGYRAMLFHCGTLLRLNEARILAQLRRVSSVSGGSITAALLGLRWRELGFAAGVAQGLAPLVIDPLLALSRRTIDIPAVLTGLALPFVSIAHRIEAAYSGLYGAATLQDLPSEDEGPRFVINATNLQSGVLFRFSRPYAGDYLIGRIKEPRISLAKAVAASSAFPPFLSPVVLRPGEVEWYPGDKDFVHLRSRIVLSDGGVYDNIGLETAFKRYDTLIVSDGGQRIEPQAAVAGDWARQSLRVFEMVDSQVRGLRKRMLLQAFTTRERMGTYFSMRSEPSKFPVAPFVPLDPARARELADTPTRLSALAPSYARRLVNYGYALCDLACRSHIDPPPAPPTDLPFPGDGI